MILQKRYCQGQCQNVNMPELLGKKTGTIVFSIRNKYDFIKYWFPSCKESKYNDICQNSMQANKAVSSKSTGPTRKGVLDFIPSMELYF